jgi:hypothetical protein
MKEQRDHDKVASHALVVIARDASGEIVTRIISRYELAGALRTARSVLRLKLAAMRVELHYQEEPTSAYSKKPLAVISTDDLVLTQNQVL